MNIISIIIGLMMPFYACASDRESSALEKFFPVRDSYKRIIFASPDHAPSLDSFDTIMLKTFSKERSQFGFCYAGMINEQFSAIAMITIPLITPIALTVHALTKDNIIQYVEKNIDLSYKNPFVLKQEAGYLEESFWQTLTHWHISCGETERSHCFFWGPFFESDYAGACFVATDTESFASSYIINGTVPFPPHVIWYHYLDQNNKHYHKQCYVSYGQYGCHPLYFDKDKELLLLLATFFPSKEVWDKKIFYTEKHSKEDLYILKNYLSSLIQDIKTVLPEPLEKCATNKAILSLFLIGFQKQHDKSVYSHYSQALNIIEKLIKQEYPWI